MRLKQSALSMFVFFLNLHDRSLLSRVYFTLCFWNFLHSLDRDHLVYRCVYELVPESNSVLLAYSRPFSYNAEND